MKTNTVLGLIVSALLPAAVFAAADERLDADVAQVRASRAADRVLDETIELPIRKLVSAAVFPFLGAARGTGLHHAVRIAGVGMAIRRSGGTDERIDPSRRIVLGEQRSGPHRHGK